MTKNGSDVIPSGTVRNPKRVLSGALTDRLHAILFGNFDLLNNLSEIKLSVMIMIPFVCAIINRLNKRQFVQVCH